jgi:large subunit ribosomal protein L10
MIAFRRAMPEGAHIMIAKNTLLRKAVEGTAFEPITEASTGMNAWVFVDENVAPTMKAVKTLTKAWKKDGKEVAFTGACMDGQFIAANKMEPLESLPTKLDLITQIAVGIKQVPTKLARGTKGTASKLGYAARAIADGESSIISA